MIIRVLILALALALPGCALIQDQPQLTNLGVSYATADFIRGQAEPQTAAQEVIGVVDKVMGYVEADEIVLISLLEGAVRESVDFNSLDPFDALLLNDLISLVREELIDRTGGDMIAAETRVAVVDVLESVRRAALIYVPY